MTARGRGRKDMTYLKNTTKKAQELLSRYYSARKNSLGGHSLFEIYDSYSQAKENALDYCKDLMRSLNGWASCFCGHNCMQFTYGFIFEQEGKKFLCYITKENDYYFEIPE